MTKRSGFGFNDTLYGAAREFVEESIGCVFDTHDVRETFLCLKDRLLCSLRYYPPLYDSGPVYHMYIVRVDWRPDIPHQFCLIRNKCATTPWAFPRAMRNRTGTHIRCAFLEKDRAMWVRWETLANAARNKPQAGSIFILRKEFAHLIDTKWVDINATIIMATMKSHPLVGSDTPAARLLRHCYGGQQQRSQCWSTTTPHHQKRDSFVLAAPQDSGAAAQ